MSAHTPTIQPIHVAMLCLSTLLVACTNQTDADNPVEHDHLERTEQPDRRETAGPKNGEHGQGEEVHAGGEPQTLGKFRFEGQTLEALRLGTIEPSGLVTLILEPTSDKDLPADLHAWIGVESGIGSVETELTDDGHDHLFARLVVPDELPAEAAIWIADRDDDERISIPFDQKTTTGTE